MQKILCATGNAMKLNIGNRQLAKYKIELEQVLPKIDEIQHDDPEYIIRDKARRAYEALGKPVIVTDDSWNIPALNGFPGPYMKYMNHWLSADDFIRLFSTLQDRSAYLIQLVAYQDENETVVFRQDVQGVLLTEPRDAPGDPFGRIVAIHDDDGRAVNEIFADGVLPETSAYASGASAWAQLGKWLRDRKT